GRRPLRSEHRLGECQRGAVRRRAPTPPADRPARRAGRARTHSLVGRQSEGRRQAGAGRPRRGARIRCHAIIYGVMADDLWSAVAFISIATSCHQAWSANMFTVASDAFPNRAVGSVVGFGGMCGGIGGMLMLLVAGGMLQWLGNFRPLFIFAGVMHPLAWIAIRALVGKNITQIDLDQGLRTAQSPALFA